MNENWKKIYNRYIEDFNAIDKLQSDEIINEEETLKLKNKLLVDIIFTFKKEVSE